MLLKHIIKYNTILKKTLVEKYHRALAVFHKIILNGYKINSYTLCPKSPSFRPPFVRSYHSALHSISVSVCLSVRLSVTYRTTEQSLAAVSDSAVGRRQIQSLIPIRVEIVCGFSLSR